jgi:hypothetical protein
VTLARKLLGHGGGSLTPPPLLISMVSIANAGSLLAQNYPNAVYHNGVTYFGYCNGDNGNIEVRTYTHATGVTSSATVVRAALEKDTHDAPSLLIRDSDKRLMVFYMKHSGGVAYLKIATDPESIASFGAEVNLHTSLGANDYTYPSVLQLTDVVNDPIYLFFRDDNTTGTPGTRASLCYSVSTDGGSTWSARTKVHAPTTERPYWMVRSNGTDRIDVFLCKDDRASVDNTPGGHVYMTGGSWYKSDGTSAGGLPLAWSAFTVVYDGTAGAVDPMDIAYDGGDPVVSWRSWVSPTPSSGNDAYYARWTGSAWDVHLIAANGYESVIDPAHPGVVYIDKLVSGKYEVHRYQTSDGGASWSSLPAKTGTTDDLTFLTGVRNAAPGLTALFSEGTYTSFTSFDFGIFGCR